MKTTDIVLKPGQRIRLMNSQFPGEVVIVGERWAQLNTYSCIRWNGRTLILTSNVEFELVAPNERDYV